MCPLAVDAPQTLEGAAAWRLALEAGVWRNAPEAHPLPGGQMIFRRVTCGLDVEAAIARIQPGMPLDIAGVRFCLTAIEAGRLAGEAELLRNKEG